MASNDSKRFYWLKLKKDFFQQHQIKVLKSLPNGRLYALIYLELLTESTSHNGELRYSALMPYDIVTLSSVIDEDKDNVEKAIETLIKLELVEILDDQTIYMREIDRLLGSETGQTIRKREAKLLGGKIYQKNTLENRDKSIDIREKNIECVKTKEQNKQIKEINKRNKYGEYKHVLLTEEQHTRLIQDYGNELINEYIKKIDEYIQLKGKGYKDYNLAIRKWLANDNKVKSSEKGSMYETWE